MPDLRLTRDLDATLDEMWDFITTPAGLLQWWGPEGLSVPEHALDFSREGPWFSVMSGSEGQRYKVSGQVTHVRPQTSVGFTWAWHDEADRRGPESHVTLGLEPLGPGRVRLVLDHVGLPDDEAAQRHTEGWTSSLKKLERRFAPA